MRLTLCLIATLIFSCGLGQNIRLKNYDLFSKSIKNTNAIVSTLEGTDQNYFFKLRDEKHLVNFRQQLVKSENHLYIIIDGTGRVYEVSEESSDSAIIRRVDSTYFCGYNADCILFSLNDTLYSLGGKGFWRENGQLRYFSLISHEWEILPISSEIPTSNLLYYVDKKRGCIYYTLMPFLDQATSINHQEQSFYKLDLNTKINTKISKIPQRHFELLQNINSRAYSFISINKFEAVLVNFNRENQYLYSFVNNEVYKLKNNKIKDIFYGGSDQNPIKFLLSKNNTIYYTRYLDTTYKVDSFNIEMTDFVKETYPLYEKPIIDRAKEYSVSISLVILITSGVFFYFKKKRKHKPPQHTEIISSDSNDDSNLSFNAIENDLINKMIDANKANRQFSVEDINVALGLGKKSLEIQKKGRTEAINRINHKFKVMFDVKEDLIQRIRSEEDRRFYKYIISEEHAKMVNK